MGNGSSVFIAFMAISGYSALILIQNAGRFVVDSNIILRPPSLAISYGCSSSSGSIPLHFEGHFSLGSITQTPLKAERGDLAPGGRMRAQAQSPQKSLLMFETCQMSLCSLAVPTAPVWL